MPRRLSFTRLSPTEQPVVFLSLAFIGGLVAAACFHLAVSFWITAAVIVWLAASVCLLKKFGEVWCIALLMGGLFSCGGALWMINEAGAQTRLRALLEKLPFHPDDQVEIWGVLDNAPELAPDRIYLSIAVEKIATAGREYTSKGNVQITVPFRDEESRVEYDRLAVDYGSRVRVAGFLNTKRGYRNPGAPDFNEILGFRGFDAAGWVKSPHQIEKLNGDRGSAILRLLYSFRARALTITLRRLRQPSSGILAAALFGNRHFLSQSTSESFRAGGTFHLLVISGAHVAMIALVSLWLVKFLSQARFIQYSAVITLMWAYALMVGAEPAITRAVVMLSIALAGQLIFRTGIGPNTLTVAAIILLAWQPRDLFNPAFQLSFLTVLMIVALTAPLYSRLKKIGEWQPAASTPYPPRAGKTVKWIAEVLFWDERAFNVEMNESHIRYRLEKAQAAVHLNRWRLQRPIEWIAVTLLVTVAIQVGLMPLLILHFHRFSVVAPVANVIESLFVFFLMIAGAAFLLLYSLIGDWGLPLAKIVEAIGRLTVKSGELLLAPSRASFRVPDWGNGWQWIFAAFFLAVLVLIICVNEWNPFRKGDERGDARRRAYGLALAAASLVVMIVIGGLLVVHPFEHRYERGRLAVTFLDVGQGDAMLIRFPRGRLMMLDSGGQPNFVSRTYEGGDGEVFIEDRVGIGEAAVMPYLWHLGIKRLDWIVCSHDDADHTGGFSEIVRGFEIGGALRGVSPKAGPDLFDRAVLLSRAPVWRVKRGDSFDIDGVRIEILSPSAGVDWPPMSDNNESLVMRIGYGRRAFLMPGDIEKEGERLLANSISDLRADVLKVAHHGSKTSSTLEFLSRVSPEHVVISVAEPSPYGHPHAETLARLETTGARIWRTSRCGAVTISTDGSDLRVETFVKCGADVQPGDSASRSFPERR